LSAEKPTRIRLRRGSRDLLLEYADGSSQSFDWEYLRVFSPSAEVRGHGAAEPVLVPGKRKVELLAVQPVGQYAVRLRFSDGHDSGLYSWSVFDKLARHREAWWRRYEQRLAELGMSRDSEVVKLAALPKKPVPPNPT